MPERYLGRTLGKYRVEALLGTGGFAWVYRAHDPDLDIPVALKVLKPQFAGDPDFEERFRREASTAAKLRHPNIVTIYSVGRDGDAVFFAMDHLPQGLADRLAVMATLPTAVLLRVGLDVANALAFAHRQGVVHRDIKPDNILFDDHGNAVVADFGIARAVATHAAETGTQLVVGTPQYFAPEQARGRPLDGRADLYALGVTLYRCAAGVLPFPGDDWYEVAKRHVEEEPVDVRTHNPALPVELARAIHCLLEKDPADRYQNAEALVEALGAVPAQLEATAATGRTMAVPALDRIWTSTGMTARRRRVRKRVLWGAGGAALVTTAAVALLAGSRQPGTAATSSAIVSDTTSLAAGVAPRLEGVLVMAAPSTAPPAIDSQVPTTGTLTVTAPDEARIFVDGEPVGAGRWRSDRMAPGRHAVHAEFLDAENCPSARDARPITITAGQARTLPLTPRRCGQLELNVLIGNRALAAEHQASYQVTGDGVNLRGSLPLTSPLVLPVGSYQVVVQVPKCNTFQAPLTISAGAVERPSIRPLCG